MIPKMARRIVRDVDFVVPCALERATIAPCQPVALSNVTGRPVTWSHLAARHGSAVLTDANVRVRKASLTGHFHGGVFGIGPINCLHARPGLSVHVCARITVHVGVYVLLEILALMCSAGSCGWRQKGTGHDLGRPCARLAGAHEWHKFSTHRRHPVRQRSAEDRRTYQRRRRCTQEPKVACVPRMPSSATSACVRAYRPASPVLGC